MSTWTSTELDTFNRTDELEITSPRGNGALRRYRTIWMVRVGDDLFVRSARGSTNPWFRGALGAGHGRIRCAGIEREVTISRAGEALNGDVDAAYHAKYDRYGARIVGAVVGSDAEATSLRLTPA